MNCPRCKTELKSEQIIEYNSSIEVDICPTYNGIWFDKDELSKIDQIIEPTFFEIRKIPSKKEQNIPLNCPSCNNLQLMRKSDHPRDKHVIIDFCPSCKGIWLDKGELEAIQKENWTITTGRILKWLFGED